MDYPVFETLLGIFAFGLVITGIVFNGILRAREHAQRLTPSNAPTGPKQLAITGVGRSRTKNRAADDSD